MMVAVFGTMAADGVHDGASIPYAVTTPIFAAVVAAVFFFPQRSEARARTTASLRVAASHYLLGCGACHVRTGYGGR